ncbi:hypothetical protein DL96DRAFT_1715 [Flagelloscypha sp. PMI_526]|nr:hypothetical protein DL96DRAFT_1715 [Flagelloscypha sp. PMI_526]
MFINQLDAPLRHARQYSLSDSFDMAFPTSSQPGTSRGYDFTSAEASSSQQHGDCFSSFWRHTPGSLEVEPVPRTEAYRLQRKIRLQKAAASPEGPTNRLRLEDRNIADMVRSPASTADLPLPPTDIQSRKKSQRASFPMEQHRELVPIRENVSENYYSIESGLPPLPSQASPARKQTLDRIREALLSPSPSFSSTISSHPSRTPSAVAAMPSPILSALEGSPSHEWIQMSSVTQGVASMGGDQLSSVRSFHARIVTEPTQIVEPMPPPSPSSLRRRGAIKRQGYTHSKENRRVSL